MSKANNVDPRELRNALGAFATGVAIVTTSEQGHDVGMTINSFSSVSLDPPMVLWSLAKTSPSLDTFKNSGYFTIHILSAEQEELSQRFATRGIDKFAGIDVSRGEAGVPVLPDCAAIFHCKTSYCYEGGDHEIFVGEVLKFEHFPKPPLVFHAGKYSLTVEKQSSPSSSPDGSFNTNSLTYLMGLVYFQLAKQASSKMKEHDIDECEMGVLTTLAMNDNRTLDEINTLVGVAGVPVTRDTLFTMVNKNLIVTNDDDFLSASLTDKGRKVLVEVVAYIQAIEDECLPNDAYAEITITKDILRNAASNLLKSKK